MSKLPIEYLQHILKECEYMTSVITEGSSKSELMEDETLKRAVVRSIEIIGEASKKIPADVKVKWKEIQWRAMTGMRDKLIHDYMGVNYSIVWDVVKNKIPTLKKQIESIIDKEG